MKTRILLAVSILAVCMMTSCRNDVNEVLAVRLDSNKLELVKGQSARLTATVIPQQDADFEWFSQDDRYVTVDQDGVVTAIALKNASEDSDEVVPVSVYVRYENGADECHVTVLPLTTEKVEIVYASDVVNIATGQTLKLEAKCFPEEADLKTLTWSTDYAAVAKVNAATGEVTGVAPGFATIRASYNEKIYDEISVNVNVK